MKVQKHNNSLETNFQGQSKEFGIGDASVVIEILRNRLYENKIQTLVQEYICNARDAMREVGKGNEFNVTAPTQLSPTFKVKDFGPGISPDRMDNVFRLYGASTKRSTNNQTGGFGIGAKSAWSYTDSFTVVTVVDGTRYSYACHTGTNIQGSVDLLSTDLTDEPNGTEIQIAVKSNDIREFNNAIARAIYFWEVKPNLNQSDLASPRTVGYKLSNNIELINSRDLSDVLGLNYDSALAVIDGVPYVISDKLMNKVKNLKHFATSVVKKRLVLHFGNGLVEVSASRESIADSQVSVDSLNNMGKQATALVEKNVTKAFSEVKTTAEWLKTYHELNEQFYVDKHSKFGEYKICNGKIESQNIVELSMSEAHCLDKRGRNRIEHITKKDIAYNGNKFIPLELLGNTFVVTKTETVVVQNRRLRAFFKGKPPELSKVILLNYHGDPANLDQVISDLGIKAFESIELPVIEKTPRVKIARDQSEFCMHQIDRGVIHTTLARNNRKWLYVDISEGSNDLKPDQLRGLNSHLEEIDSDLQVVGLSSKALKHIQGDPNFQPLQTWLDTFVPTKAQINYAICEEAKNKEAIEVVADLKGIEDEFLNSMIKEYKTILNEKRTRSEMPSLLIAKVKEHAKAKVFFDNDDKLADLFTNKYSLVQEVKSYSEAKKELTYYINAKYNN